MNEPHNPNQVEETRRRRQMMAPVATVLLALTLVEGVPAEAALVAPVRRQQTERDEEERDRRLIASLDAIRLAQAEIVASENRFAVERAVPRLREVFQAYGLPAGEGDPAAVAARLRRRPAVVRQALVAALDQWIELAADPRFRITEPHLDWLRAVVAAVEPDDAWMRELRAAGVEKDPAKRRAALEKLAASADPGRLAVQTLTRLAERLWAVGARENAVQILRKAQKHYPGDFWVNEHLGLLLSTLTPPDLEGAVRYHTAAVALRPDSPGPRFNLGAALQGKGQLDEAIACYRQAIALDPKYAAAHINLGSALNARGQLDEAIACYRHALTIDPRLTQAHHSLGVALTRKGQLDEAIASYRRAIELDPKNAAAHISLGTALFGVGRPEEAAACFRQAITLDPKLVTAHLNLGVVLQARGQLDEASACFRQAIALDPKLAQAHYNLGLVLHRKGQADDAIACFRRVLQLDPKHAAAHTNLGLALHARGQLEEAIACYRGGIVLDPKNAPAYLNLGVALQAKGQLDEAIASFRKAIALDPKSARMHGALGGALLARGRYAEAREATARALELLLEKHPLREGLSRQLQSCEKLLKLEERLPRVLRGEDQPVSAQEGLELVTLCQHRRLHSAAVRFAAAAFAAEPKLADDRSAGPRYHAACSAALAGAGQGEDAPADEKVRTRLRKQALDWLRADLAAWTRQLESGPPADRAAAQKMLRHWQQDSDLAGIRDRAALAKVPEDERAALSQLWADVAALLQKAEGPTRKESQP
jgi:superkiller protein 3